MQTIIVTVNQQGEKTALQIETYCHVTKHRCTLRFRPAKSRYDPPPVIRLAGL